MGANISLSGRRMSDRTESERNHDSDSDQDADIATILQYLIRSGQVRVVPDSDRLFHDDSDDEFSTTASPPQEDPNPDTSLIDKSDLRQAIILQSGSSSINQSTGSPYSLMNLVRKREVGMNGGQHFSRGDQCQISTRLLPNKMNHVERYRSKAFCGTYARDGEILMTACQDCNIRIYDMCNGKFKLMKTVLARDVGWSILDTAVSPDGSHFVYSSWSECMHICNIFGEHENHEALPLCPDDRRFCIFSLRFSQCGNEILGGANDECLYIYDREIHRRTLKIHSHDDDVNSVAFADCTSQILFSGGDDGLVKVWDRRTLSENLPKPVGIMAGHREGITYIDPKGDGRHFLTNSKDQTIKLWDMRSFSPAGGADETKKMVGSTSWDYRWQRVPKKLCSSSRKITSDTSLMTYRGHSVLQTLIRCHFSPEATTGQKYVYTGCGSGGIVVYDVLTGKIVTKLKGHKGCVRDVSWHPYKQEIISSSWDGTVGRWVYTEKHLLDSSDEDSDYYDGDRDYGYIERRLSNRRSSGASTYTVAPRRSRRIAEQLRQKRLQEQLPG